MDYSIFSQRLTELVESRGKNISGVAVDIGVTPATISRYVVGIRYPDLRIVIRLAKSESPKEKRKGKGGSLNTKKP